MDTGVLGSTFSQVTDYSSNAMTYTLTTATNGIVSGTVYTFKYIAENAIGFSSFSSEARFAAASPPS